MRIDAGSHKGVKLAAPEGADTRPTSDRARQAVFNILIHTYDAVRGAKVLDVFAGSGALGLEALSRGAERVTFIESDRSAADCIKRNIAACRAQAQSQVFIADARARSLGSGAWSPCSLVFLDPPYGQGLVTPALTALNENGWIAAEALIVAEVDRKDVLEPPPVFTVLDDRLYGKARILILRNR
jgi:16S rRNA (guanine966-N2)-methyltransferase